MVESSDDTRESRWHRLVERIDNSLVPAVFAAVCVLCLAQLVTAIPSVRSYVDATAGRFVRMRSPDVVPASVRDRVAEVTLFAAPGDANPGVLVLVNGTLVGQFATSSVRVNVREGDRITIRNGGDRRVVVTVNHDDPYLLLPAPGQTVVVDPGETSELPAGSFVQ